jgi:general stress protein 26
VKADPSIVHGDEPPGDRDEDTVPVRAATLRLRARIGELAIAMVTSTDRRFMPSSRPLLTQQFDKDGVLWFVARSDGSLAEDLETNPRVSVSYCDPGRGLYISLSGFARFVHDPERILSLWDERLLRWFPEGPTDSGLALLRVDVDRAESWDEPSSRMVRLLARAQAALRGEHVLASGEHERLKLHRRPDGTGATP